MKSSTSETVISDDHKTTYTFLKSTYDKGNLSLFTIDASKTLTKNYLRKIFLKISKTLVIRLKCFMALSRTL